jgi:hypothetical protein
MNIVGCVFEVYSDELPSPQPKKVIRRLYEFCEKSRNTLLNNDAEISVFKWCVMCLINYSIGNNYKNRWSSLEN